MLTLKDSKVASNFESIKSHSSFEYRALVPQESPRPERNERIQILQNRSGSLSKRVFHRNERPNIGEGTQHPKYHCPLPDWSPRRLTLNAWPPTPSTESEKLLLIAPLQLASQLPDSLSYFVAVSV